MKITKNPIYTARLVLKQYEPEDRDRLVEMMLNSEISKYFMVPDYPEMKQYYELADKLILFSRPDNETHLEYGVYYDGVLIGFVNDCGFDEEELEIGYVIHPDWQHRGFASEAVKAVIEELWKMGFQKVSAGFFEQNTASLKVMERCGMVLNGEVEEEEYRGEKFICHYCEILRPQQTQN